MRQRFRLACVLGPAAVLLAAGRPAAQPPRQPGVPERIYFGGAVAAVDKESISVRGYDFELTERGDRTRTVSTDYGADVTGGDHTVVFYDRGPLGWRARTLKVIWSEVTREVATVVTPAGEELIFHLADQPVRKFPARGPLAEGGYDKSEAGGWSYRLADVAVGDRVGIIGHQVAGVEYVEAISIGRRPGGQVPPAPGDVAKPPPANQQWFHEVMNARQEAEEKGEPWPLTPEQRAIWRSVKPPPRPAPPPREVKPKPPGR
ncbi:MAG: hypothetical protein K2X82_23915 [Gemmataceae bacterium]|nr:hypothetical protein [Gemmataceae bacterium]